MDEAAERIHEATEELRRSLVGLDGRAQLRLLNGSTAAVARLRVEIERMRADALGLLVNDLQGEIAIPKGRDQQVQLVPSAEPSTLPADP